MPTFLGRARRWLLAGGLAVAGVLAAFAASTHAASSAGTTTATTTTATTTTAPTTTTTTTTATTTTAPTTTAPAAPSSSSPPTVSGTPQEGATLTASTGSWRGNPTSYAYQWERCDSQGGSCANVSGAQAKTYALKSVDVGNTLRVAVTATNAGGSSSAVSVPTAVIAAQAKPAPTGCPSAKAGQVVDVSQVAPPARLQIAAFQSDPARLTHSMQQFSLRVVVDDTCGHPVKGALVYATAVPFEQVTIPPEQPTGADGSVTLHFGRATAYPASPRQQLLALFIRARKPGNELLAGISTRRLVSVPVARRS